MLAYFNLFAPFMTKFLPAYIQKLLQEVKKDRELAQAVIGEGPPPILYLDCRGNDISSPKRFASAIRQLVVGDAGLKKWWAGIKLKFPGIELDLEKMFAPAADKTPMECIIASLTTFLEATRPLDYKPVIIIDEANKLMRWSDDPDKKELKNLLDFFVRTTKQEHLGHFVLASSESFVIDFLEKGKLRNCPKLAMCIVGTCLLIYLFAFFPRQCSFTSCFFLNSSLQRVCTPSNTSLKKLEIWLPLMKLSNLSRASCFARRHHCLSLIRQKMESRLICGLGCMKYVVETLGCWNDAQSTRTISEAGRRV